MEKIEPELQENQQTTLLALPPSDPTLYEKSRRGVVVVCFILT